MIDLIKHLRMLAEGGEPTHKELGLCSELETQFPGRQLTLTINRLSASWEHYAGLTWFPVPSSHKHHDSASYYIRFKNKWDGEQGRFRRDLCAHIADQLEKENG